MWVKTQINEKKVANLGKVWILLLVLCLWIGAGVRHAQSDQFSPLLRLHELRFSVEKNHKSVLLRFSRPPDRVHTFSLPSPPRLVIDVNGPVTSVSPQVYPLEDALLSQVRIASHPHRIRFVLDLKAGQVPSFSVEQHDKLLTVLFEEQSEGLGEAYSRVLFSLPQEESVPPPQEAHQDLEQEPPLPREVRHDPKQASAPPPRETHHDLGQKRAEAQRHLGQGQRLYAQGNVDGAITEWQEAARLVPHIAKVHHLLGLALQERGDVAAAITAFQETLRLDPNNATALVHLARAFEHKKDLRAAFTIYQRAVHLVPTSAYVHDRLGHLLAAKEDWVGAVKEWQQTLQIRPEYAQAQVSLAEALEQLGKPQAARAAYERAIALEPRAPFAKTVHRRLAGLRAAEAAGEKSD